MGGAGGRVDSDSDIHRTAARMDREDTRMDLDELWCSAHWTPPLQPPQPHRRGCRSRTGPPAWACHKPSARWPGSDRTGHGTWRYGVESGAEPSSQHPLANPLGHGHGVEQGPVGGHIPVIGHGGQHVALGGGPGGKGEELGDSSHKGSHLLLHQNIPQAPGDDGGGAADVQQGHVAQEEVHGGVEVWIDPDQHDGSQIS